MRRDLIPHPDWPHGGLTGVWAQAARPEPGRLELRYGLEGRIGEVRFPPAAPPRRTDGLWAHTCFEAFLRPDGGDGYAEFNFAPSGAWAAYRFTGYRERMAEAPLAEPPRIEVPEAGGHFELAVRLSLAGLPELAGSDWRVGISAVIEDLDGGKSYWALAHPPGKADFHHADCFALELPAPQYT
jgi:hypothetical protein